MMNIQVRSRRHSIRSKPGLSVVGGAWPPALRDSLAAFWALDEASGTRADSIGSNTLTDNNTVGSDTGLVYGTAADFVRANTEYLSIASNSDVQTGDFDFAVAAWINLGVLHTFQEIATKWLSTGDQREYIVRVQDNNQCAFLISEDGGGAGSVTTIANTGVTLAADAWYLVTAYNDQGTEVGIAVNDGAAATTTHTGGAFAGSAEFAIGARAGGLEPFSGRIGPVMIFKNYVPTAADRAFLYNSGNGRRL